MASGLSFFLSSPPQPSENSWSRPKGTNTFYTPQPTSKHIWPSVFAPTSPSPLRTSFNANLMSSPSSRGDFSKRKPGTDINNENTPAGDGAETPVLFSTFSPATTTASTNTSTTFNPFTSTTQPTTFNFTPQQSNTFTSKETHFSNLSRASSPSAQLQSHATSARESRKRVFLDRSRKKRDEARVDRAGDQVLRLDYIRERRAWEERLERERELEMGVGEEVGDEEEEVMDEGWLTPPEEEEVIDGGEEMLGFQISGEGETGTMLEEFSDDGYDEVFMEVLSQESGGLNARSERGGGLSDVGDLIMSTQPTDSEMDMS